MDAMTFNEAASFAARQGRLTAEERARLDAAISTGAPPYAALHWDETRLAVCTPFYYADMDTLHLLEQPVQPHFVMDASEHALLRVHPDTFKVLGAFIEDFEARFLPLHPEFREAWERVIKPHLAGERHANADELAQFNLALIRRILAALRESEKPAKAQA